VRSQQISFALVRRSGTSGISQVLQAYCRIYFTQALQEDNAFARPFHI
jgi:hypothetical protein